MVHANVRAQIEAKQEPRAYSHTVHEARMHSQLVGLQASLLDSHLSGMLERLDKGPTKR